MKPSLIVIDMQNKWLAPTKTFVPELGLVVQKINRLSEFFKKNGWPILVVTLEHNADGGTLSPHDKKIWNVTGSEDAKLISDLTFGPNVKFFVKNRYSCFHGTNILSLLKEESVSKVLLCGYQLSACILASALDAYQFDFQPLVVADCVLDANQRELDYFLEYFKRADCLTTTSQWLGNSSE